MVFEQIVWSGRRVGNRARTQRQQQQHNAKDDDDQVRDVDFSCCFHVFFCLGGFSFFDGTLKLELVSTSMLLPSFLPKEAIMFILRLF